VDAERAAEEPWESFSRRVKPQVGAKFEQAIDHYRKTAGEHLARWRAVDWIAADFLSGVRIQGSEWSDRLEAYNWKQGLRREPKIASPLPLDPRGLQGEGPGVRDRIPSDDESLYDFARRDLEETSERWKAIDWSPVDAELPPEIAPLAEDLEQTTPHELHERIIKIIQFLQQIESEMAPLSRRFHAAGGTHALAFFDHRHYLEQSTGLPARAFWRFAQHNRWARLSPALKDAFAQGAIHREHSKEIARAAGVLPEQPWIERDGWRCQAPGCFSRRNLHAHHVVFRSRGGGDDDDNRTTICWSCHLHGVHEGRIKVTGEAPSALSWEVGCRRDGPPLRVYA